MNKMIQQSAILLTLLLAQPGELYAQGSASPQIEVRYDPRINFSAIHLSMMLVSGNADDGLQLGATTICRGQNCEALVAIGFVVVIIGKLDRYLGVNERKANFLVDGQTIEMKVITENELKTFKNGNIRQQLMLTTDLAVFSRIAEGQAVTGSIGAQSFALSIDHLQGLRDFVSRVRNPKASSSKKK